MEILYGCCAGLDVHKQMILHAIVAGETEPARLALLAVGRVRASQQELESALPWQSDGSSSVHAR